MECNEVTSLTVSMERTLLTTVIEAQAGQDVATCDIPNAFVQTHVEEKDKDGNQTIMKIRGVCVDILCETDPIYWDYMVMKGNQKVLYVHITQAIYRTLVSAMLFYCRLTKALLSYSFELNPHNPCVADKIVNGEQLTVCWHVEDLKSSHINPKVNDKFLQWIKDMFGQLSEVKMTQGPIHDYLGMTHLKGASVTLLRNENLFKVQHDSVPLEKEQAELFHTIPCKDYSFTSMVIQILHQQ